LEDFMDGKDKGVIEKTIEAVEEFASEVKDAAKHMMDPPEPLKPGDEVVMLPAPDDGMFGAPMTPQFMVVHHRKRRSKKVPKKTAKKTAKKSAAKKVPPKKVSPKKAKKSKAKSVAKKTTKKTAKKKKAKR
jgi:hypothetical protein